MGTFCVGCEEEGQEVAGRGCRSECASWGRLVFCFSWDPAVPYENPLFGESLLQAGTEGIVDEVVGLNLFWGEAPLCEGLAEGWAALD